MQKFSSKTKTNFRRSSTKRRVLKRVAVLTVLLLAVFFLFRGALGTFAGYVSGPFFTVASWVTRPIDAFSTSLQNTQELEEKIAELEDLVERRSQEQALLDATQRENENLRELLSVKGDERILAGVLIRPSKLPYDTILIDRGRQDGVLQNVPVYAAGNQVIGNVSRVYERSALVTLISSPGFISTVYVYGPNIFTEATGEGGGVIRIGVPQGITLTQGDAVVLPSVDPGYFGTISHIRTSESSPEQYGYVTGGSGIGSIRYVAVGKRPIETIDYETAARAIEEMRDELFQVAVPEDVLISTSTATTSEADRSTES